MGEDEKKLRPLAIIIDDTVDSELHDQTKELQLVIEELDTLDLDFLRGRTIETLRIMIRNDAVLDLSPLTQMPVLKRLILEVNSIKEEALDILTRCDSLIEVRINTKQNTALDLSQLNASKIKKLIVWAFNMDGGTLPENESIEELTCIFEETSKIDLAPLKKCRDITTLGLGFSKAFVDIDLKPLSSCKKLAHFALTGTGIADVDLTPLSYVYLLKTLVLDDNKLKGVDFSPLGGITALEQIYLRSNQIKELDLTPLSGTSLQELWLDKNNMERIDLTDLPKTIKKLILSRNNLSRIDLEPLRECDIEILNLRSNKIKHINIDPLLDCEHLREVHLRGNLIRSAVRHINKLATKYVHEYPYHVEVSGDPEIFPD
jgi:Leucine-rich repeat (LRR) protein